MAKRKKQPSYEPPEIVGDVDALPPVYRPNRNQSVYDDAIIKAIENQGRWIIVDPMGRTPQSFKLSIKDRLEKLDMDMDMQLRQRAKFVYMRYNGEAEGMVEMIERVREEARAVYGE